MVVLAASICTHGGKPVISRQFRELTKDRVTALLASFPNLLSSVSNTQHTTVEDEFVRYVYQPLEEYYVVLITNKHSNILQDINTLHLFSKVITSILGNIDEREIFDNCFELLSAFDEIVTLGYKENLESHQIMEFLAMDSHEERIQEIIDRNKELEATEASKRKAIELKMKELSKKSMGYENDYGMSGGNIYSQPPNAEPWRQQYQQQQYQDPGQIEREQIAEMYQSNKQPTRKGGLQLGKKPVSAIDAQPLLVNPSSVSQPAARQISTPEPSKPSIINNGILLTMNEKFSAQITREGTLSSCEVKGDLQVRINDPELAHVKMNLSLSKQDEVSTQFKTHPNIDKKLFNTSEIIGLKDPTKPFPSNDQNLGVLRWRSTLKTKDVDDNQGLLPIMITTWVNNNNDGTIGLTFEYEVQPEKNVDEVSIMIPIMSVTLESSDHDNVSLSNEDGVIVKLTDLIANPSGSFEVICNEVDDDEALFPMEIIFDSCNLVEPGSKNAEVVVESVVAAINEEPMPFEIYYCANSEGYYIV
ncbi:coatomer subunit delta [Martiniozyma asiatica (nom. inval.)]|nr:coatomer subunit delta [Martiniozyma asiatica]